MPRAYNRTWRPSPFPIHTPACSYSHTVVRCCSSLSPTPQVSHQTLSSPKLIQSRIVCRGDMFISRFTLRHWDSRTDTLKQPNHPFYSVSLLDFILVKCFSFQNHGSGYSTTPLHFGTSRKHFRKKVSGSEQKRVIGSAQSKLIQEHEWVETVGPFTRLICTHWSQRHLSKVLVRWLMPDRNYHFLIVPGKLERFRKYEITLDFSLPLARVDFK